MTDISERPAETDAALPLRSEVPKPVRVLSARISLRQRLIEIWRYRELFVGLVRKELKVKYKESTLGFLWSLLNPAITLLVYYVVFQLVLKNGIPNFAIFLVSGILVWNLFSTSLPGATGSVVGNSAIVKKVSFPREVLALASVGAGAVHFVLQSIVLVCFLIGFRYTPAWGYLWLLIPAIIALLLFTAALGVFFAAVNVYFRDTQHLLEVALMVWFWATPIVYQYRLIADQRPALARLWRLINPMVPIVLTFQRAIYRQTEPKGSGGSVINILPPDAGQWWYLKQLLFVIVLSVILSTIALRVFGRLEGNFAEEL
jgi:ABC-2 type transport system permease protein